MRVTPKGQITIPRHIREKLGITQETEVDFVEENDRVYIVKRRGEERRSNRFARLRGIAKIRMSTDEILALTRR